MQVRPFPPINGSTAWGQVRPRVVEAVNNDQRITLKGNVHPLARAEFHRGAVAETQPMTRMLLLLKRGDDQEAAQSSPDDRAWLMPEEFGANYGPADAANDQGYLNNPGLYQVTATYSGDTSNLPSTSAALTQVITGTMPATIQANTGGDIRSLQVLLYSRA